MANVTVQLLATREETFRYKAQCPCGGNFEATGEGAAGELRHVCKSCGTNVNLPYRFPKVHTKIYTDKVFDVI